ncbi:glycosyltransferase [Lachnospiraceae bacterium]|nr:glycosyltransferase [uncultured Schaedlerella sp.]MCI9152203.1 glycosyltransferase [Ruminococcus sp.]NBI57889.1 glycosyltransferase [Lachnospiraceae bacterium]
MVQGESVKNMDILYLGYFCNESLFNTLVKKGSNSSHARQQFERKLLCGLKENMKDNSIHIRSYLPLMDRHLRKINGENYCGYDIDYMWCEKRIGGVLNALISNKKYIENWASRSGGKKVILTYSANPLHCIPAMLLRRKYGYKVVTISSEISVFRRPPKNLILFWIWKKISFYLENNFDAYILLSKYMNNVVNTTNKPYIVMEGFSEPEIHLDNDALTTKNKMIFFYAGWLSEDNGIKILVEGFRYVTHKDMELWICGGGGLVNYVKEQAEKDPRIKYLGIKPNEEVQRLERKASFLINPRFSNEEYTKYSFPSKTLEYMSTGTPTILTRLKGIPEEYFDYSIVLENESTEGIKSLLENIRRIPYEDYTLLGKRALDFVSKNKTPMIQVRRIMEFVYNL